MNYRRKIKPEEINLIEFLLKKMGLNSNEYPISDLVDEYEGYVMAVSYTHLDVYKRQVL